jgi:biopolymer transport protein ExbD
MPPKALAKVGLIALALAILLPWAYAHWLKTRTFELVDKAVLLETGRVQTEDFEINLREDYLVQIEVNFGTDYVSERDCPYRWWEASDWRIYRLSGRRADKRELWASSVEILKEGEFPIGFKGKPGKYQMEWSVPTSQACLNRRQARLRVYTSSLGYEEFGGFLLFACIFLAGTGVLLVLRAIGKWGLGYFIDKRPLRMFPEMELRNVIPWKRHRPMPLIREFPNFGLLWGGVLYILFNIFAVMITPFPPQGLTVELRQRTAVEVAKSPWTETVRVYVDAQRGFLLNGGPVRGEELGAKLKKELSRQIVWTVYLEADSDCLFMDVAYAMDTIQGLGAKLVWITPKTREEWKQKSIR